MPDYIIAASDKDYKTAAGLFKEYATAINIDLQFQHFDEELSELQEMYSFPEGGIILCRFEDEYIGCVAIRKIDAETGELKRMYVKPTHQNKSIGKALLQEAIELARKCRYSKLRLDTLNYMQPAIRLYKKYGFYEIPAYYFNPIPTAVFFEMIL
ncbi:MAG: GNAT family N-acetyltransferase [Ferruginibacter sp.]